MPPEPEKRNVKPGDLIALHEDDSVDEAVRGLIAQVAEVKPWGVVCFVDYLDGSRRHRRAEWSQFDLN